ncbi:toprim domain-containing protein [Nocardiopsis sp. NPDC049922]|uniref:toprim domain-containing protein n=1 Tax=Nocardiopsis sp. NPDC049922 TaxID=3155157 RepID=UPI0033F22B90
MSKYQADLSPDAEGYLTGERGLTRETVDRFRLGYVETPLPGHEHVRGHLAIPYLTPDGDIVSMRFRRLFGSGGPKYMSMAADIPRIYNTAGLEVDMSGIVVCEGEIDTMTAIQCGLPAVGIPGAQAWQKRWWRLLVQYRAVFVLHDDDEPGRDFARKISESLENVRMIPMTGGDVNSYFREHGASGLKQKVGING